jgi:hypothetical protein
LLHLGGRSRKVCNDLKSYKMKSTSILLFVILIASLAACKKSSNAPVEGKWKETKMHLYNQDIITGAISGDTTYQANTFGNFDYVQFESNGTCILSATGLINNSQQQITKVQDTYDFTYTKAGSGFALTPEHTNPSLISGIYTTYTVSGISGNTLILHSVAGYINPSVPYKTMSDAYYTK